MKGVPKVTLLSHHVGWGFQGSFYEKGDGYEHIGKFRNSAL